MCNNSKLQTVKPAQIKDNVSALHLETNTKDNSCQNETTNCQISQQQQQQQQRQQQIANLALYFSILYKFLLQSIKFCLPSVAVLFFTNLLKVNIYNCRNLQHKLKPHPNSEFPKHSSVSVVLRKFNFFSLFFSCSYIDAIYRKLAASCAKTTTLIQFATATRTPTLRTGNGSATSLRRKVIRLQGICIIRLITLLKERFFQIPKRKTRVLHVKSVQQPVSFLFYSFICSRIFVVGSSSSSAGIGGGGGGCQQQLVSFAPFRKIKCQIVVLTKCVLSVLSVCCRVGGAAVVPHLQRSLTLLLLLSTLWHGSECFHGSVKLGTNTIKTKYGLLRGIVVRSSPLVEAYLGIPYASPPVGSLRYMPPITPSTWKNVRNADRFSAVCPQIVPIPPNGPEALLEIPRARLAQLRRLLPLLKNQSEDCLYLNIYVPYENQNARRANANGESNEDDTQKLATLLFIHGESYEWNSGNPYDGSELAAQGNVIVVTINFRLGIFGFLKTGGKESAQGNFGLMDLVAGLHWLKENLPAFGGDPQGITILGHGSGAALANILLVSPVASDLLHRAVLVSGSAISPWAIQKNPLFVKRRVAEQTGCHGDMLYDDLAPCLRTKTVAELLEVKIDHPRFLVGFAPFVDGTVISPNSDPIRALTLPLGSAIVSTSGIEFANFPKRDLIFCLTSVESYLDLSAQDLEFGFNETRRDRILRTFVRNNFHYHLNEIFAVLKNEYTDWEKAIRNPMSSRDATLAFLSDGHTASTLVKLGYMHSLRGGRSYFLHFKHKTVEEEYPQRTGSVRGEDVPFWLGLPISPLFPYNYTTQEKQISRLMLRYLANFAKTGNPNQSMKTAETSTVTQHVTGAHLHRQDPVPNISSEDHLSSSNYPIENKPLQQQSSTESFSQKKVKRFASSAKRNDLIHKFLNLTDAQIRHQSKGSLEAIEATKEALNLAIIYNQRRSNAMKVKRSSFKRHSNSNDESNYFTTSNTQGDAFQLEHLPFWDAYDVVNQLYLELGNKVEVQSHYRGHKLSMWLNLIPQLHRHSNINDQSMRHHQFPDDANSRDQYEGAVRPQLQTKPDDVQDEIILKTPKATVPAKVLNATSKTSANNAYTITATTECGTDATAFITDLGTPVPPAPPTDNRTVLESHKELATASTGLIGNLEVLRRLGGKQFQSYTTALVATVAVGCFLLVLNVLIFAGIYHQREKRARDNKTKEELQDSDTSKNSSMLKLNTAGLAVGGDSSGHYSGKNAVIFGEYNCYDEKSMQSKDEKLIVELPPHTPQMLDSAWACSTSTLDLLKTKQNNPADLMPANTSVPEHTDVHFHAVHSSIEMNTYNTMNMMPTPLDGAGLHIKRGSIGCSSITHPNQFDYAVQSSDMSFKEMEDAIKASSEDIVRVQDEDDDDDDIPEPPPPPKSFQNNQQVGGILRQAGASSMSTSSGKKRVHIQEISV